MRSSTFLFSSYILLYQCPRLKPGARIKRTVGWKSGNYGSKFFNRDKLVTAFSRTRRINAQKMKFSIKDFFSKCGQIRSITKHTILDAAAALDPPL